MDHVSQMYSVTIWNHQFDEMSDHMDVDEFIHVEEVMRDKHLPLFFTVQLSQERTECASAKFLTLKKKIILFNTESERWLFQFLRF